MPSGSFLSNSKVHEGAKSQNKHPSWIYYTVVGLSEAVSGGFLLKRLFLKISQYPQEKPELESLLKKLQVWRPATLLKRAPNTGFFLWILQNFWEWLLFYYFNRSLLHRPEGSRSRLYDRSGFRVWVTGLVFCF